MRAVVVPHLMLRNATMEDAQLIFGWRNDPWIIKKGSLNREVPWEEHLKWFSSLIADANSHMYIIEIEGQEAGQVRFIGQENAQTADISIYLLEPFIGQGMGAKALTQACQDIRSHLAIKAVIAYILKDNSQSQMAFEKAGFMPLDKCGMTLDDIDEKPDHKTYCLKL